MMAFYTLHGFYRNPLKVFAFAFFRINNSFAHPVVFLLSFLLSLENINFARIQIIDESNQSSSLKATPAPAVYSQKTIYNIYTYIYMHSYKI